jgi:hypothetical protein
VEPFKAARVSEEAISQRAWLRDGKVYREETFTNRGEALQAVGSRGL